MVPDVRRRATHGLALHVDGSGASGICLKAEKKKACEMGLDDFFLKFGGVERLGESVNHSC